jgi:hypothetical protein
VTAFFATFFFGFAFTAGFAMVRIGANRDTVALFFAADFLLAFTVFFTDRFLGARNTGN